MILSEIVMKALDSLQKQSSFAYEGVINNINYISMDCRYACSGSCDGDCSGSCYTNCVGGCDGTSDMGTDTGCEW